LAPLILEDHWVGYPAIPKWQKSGEATLSLVVVGFSPPLLRPLEEDLFFRNRLLIATLASGSCVGGVFPPRSHSRRNGDGKNGYGGRLAGYKLATQALEAV